MKRIEVCMRYKCKVCPIKMRCDKTLTHFTWRPFENIKEILDAKQNKSLNQH